MGCLTCHFCFCVGATFLLFLLLTKCTPSRPQQQICGTGAIWIRFCFCVCAPGAIWQFSQRDKSVIKTGNTHACCVQNTHRPLNVENKCNYESVHQTIESNFYFNFYMGKELNIRGCCPKAIVTDSGMRKAMYTKNITCDVCVTVCACLVGAYCIRTTHTGCGLCQPSISRNANTKCREATRP